MSYAEMEGLAGPDGEGEIDYFGSTGLTGTIENGRSNRRPGLSVLEIRQRKRQKRRTRLRRLEYCLAVLFVIAIGMVVICQAIYLCLTSK